MDDDDALAELLEDSLLDDERSQGETRGLILLAMRAALRSTRDTYMTWIDPDSHRQASDLWIETWWEWATAVREFRHSSSSSVDVGAIAVVNPPAIVRGGRQVEDLREGLESVFRKAAGRHFPGEFKGGILIWERLFGPTGTIGKLRQPISTLSDQNTCIRSCG